MYSQSANEQRPVLERAGEIYRYTVRPGDYPYALAQRFGTTVELINGLNGLTNDSVLQIGQELLIPVLFNKPAAPMRSYAATYPAMYY